MKTLDKTFDLGAGFFKAMTGEGGQGIIESTVAALLPTRAKAACDNDSLSQLRVLRATDVFQFVGVGPQWGPSRA